MLAKPNCWKHFAIHKLEQGKLRKQHRKQIQRRSTLSHSFWDKPPNFLLTNSGSSWCSWRTFAFNLGAKNIQSLVYSQMSCLGSLVKTGSFISLETKGRNRADTVASLRCTKSLLLWDWVLLVPVCSLDGRRVGWFPFFEFRNIQTGMFILWFALDSLVKATSVHGKTSSSKLFVNI